MKSIIAFQVSLIFKYQSIIFKYQKNQYFSSIKSSNTFHVRKVSIHFIYHKYQYFSRI